MKKYQLCLFLIDAISSVIDWPVLFANASAVWQYPWWTRYVDTTLRPKEKAQSITIKYIIQIEDNLTQQIVVIGVNRHLREKSTVNMMVRK